MSESQSRYSIVERLTNKKLKIMDEKLDLDENIENKKAEILRKEQRLETWKAELERDLKREQREQEDSIKILKTELDNMGTFKKEKIKSFDLKLAEIDKSLVTLNQISQAATSQAEKC